jgi:hypothetical protein
LARSLSEADRVQDLAAQRQDRLGLADPRLLGRAAGGIALDQEDLGALAAIDGAIRELARQAQLARGSFARDLLGALAREPLVGPAQHVLEQRAPGLGMAGEPVIEVVLERGLDLPPGLGRHELVLGLALELRVLGEQGEQHAGAADQVVGGDLGDLLAAGELAIGP